MKKEKENWTYLFIILGLLMLILNHCKKDNNIIPDNPANGKTTAIFNTGLVYGTLTDQDGNTYKTIKIGTQTWMAENLRTTKYRNLEAIPEVRDSIAWGNLKYGAYCNSGNSNNLTLIATFGRLYNWYAVSDIRNLAPSGWHVATIDEWTLLNDYLGGKYLAGGKLKESGTLHWEQFDPYYSRATNETGFTSLPCGLRNNNGWFYPLIGYYGYWWSCSEANANEAKELGMFYDSGTLGSFQNPKEIGCAVRCIKD